MAFYTTMEQEALRHHAHIKQLNVLDAARRFVDAAESFRITLGASPNNYTDWQQYVAIVKENIETIERRAARK